MEQENSSYFKEVKNNFSISVFINLIKLYFVDILLTLFFGNILHLFLLNHLLSMKNPAKPSLEEIL